MTPLIKVLYVDDNPLDRELVRDALEKEQEGFQVTEASSRREFEARLQESGFDLVLSDFNILGFEGLQVIEAVQANSPDLPVIIVTGTGSEEIAVEALRAGASDYVIKTPRHIQRLPITIQAVLEKRRLQAENARSVAELQEARRDWEEIFQAIGHPTCILDPEHNVITANRATSQVTGLPAAELRGKKCYEIFHGAQQPPEHCPLEEMLHTGRLEAREMEMDALGGVFIVSCTPVQDEAGRLEKVIHIATDITARKRAEEALRKSEEKYRQLVQQIPAVVYKGYRDWSLDCFDQKIEGITGYLMEEFNTRQKTWLDLIFPEDIDQAKNLLLEALKGDGSYVTEHRIHKKTGEVRWIQARNRIIRNAAGKFAYISGVFFDITERKDLEDQLLKAQKMEAVGILAGGVAHDFNNLLTAIMGYGEIMMMGLRQHDPFYPYIEEILKAASRGGKLTHQLLAFSRKQILQPRVVNLNDVVKDMDKMLRRLIGEDVDLLTLIDPDLGLTQADPGQIEQIIMNLAVNARDAMPQGGKLTIETANVFLDQPYARSHMDVAPGPYVMLAISDNGLGMDAETIARIYEPFFTTKEEGKGTGLGLSTVYGIVKQSGGHIWAYSEPGQGTTFKIYLPRLEQGNVEVKPEPAAPASLGGNETILVVEDDAALRELISTALRKYGFTVVEAGNGDDALLICEQAKAPIHLMLTDVVMPQMSGRVLAEQLAALHPEMKVIFMSGYTGDAIVHHGVLDSGLNFIQKPFKILSLIEKVRGVLGAVAPA